MSKASGITANVVWSDPQEDLLLQARGSERDGDGWTFGTTGLPVWDRMDPQSGALYLGYLMANGLGAVIVAPDLEATEDGVAELERRITRDLGGDFTIDDWGPSAPVAVPPLALSADEARALLDLLCDSELYVAEDDGTGWIDRRTEAAVLAPLRERLLSSVPVAPPAEPRTFLLHLNVEVPADSDASVHDLEAEVLGALEVGTDSDMTPYLSSGVVEIALAEEVC